jgi:hypothetical protein
MRAIRCEKPGGGYAVHWLADDDGWTLCGRRVPVLLMVERLELVELPADSTGCDVCEVMRARPDAKARRRAAVTSEPRSGRLYTTGPLYHGPSSHPDAGRRLSDGE